MGRTEDIECLLVLDGEILVQTNAGHWVKIEACRVPRTKERPHGVRYSLTLHAPDNQRVLGYDNAHGVAKRQVPFDHRHRSQNDEGEPYSFTSVEQLLADFFRDVDRWLKYYGH